MERGIWGVKNSLLRLLLLCVMAVCLFLLGRAYCQSLKQKEQLLLKEKASGEGTQDRPETADPGGPEDIGGPGDTTGSGSMGSSGETTGSGSMGGPGETTGPGSIGSSEEMTDPGSIGGSGETTGPGSMGGSGDTNGPGNMGSPGAMEQDPPTMLEKYKELYEQNSELVGWLAIEGMDIDYPVMQTDDNEYYLRHDFFKQDNSHGCLYVKGKADLEDGTNFIIYGHNMRDKTMFGTLDSYLDETFYKEHPTVRFDTLYEERTYDIVAVFRSQVYRVGDDVFKYYQFYQADTQEEFDDFYSNIKELSLYDTGVTVEFGDRFLTLSTCSYHVEDGRFVVVAKLRQ